MEVKKIIELVEKLSEIYEALGKLQKELIEIAVKMTNE